jgi:hypothetical protein
MKQTPIIKLGFKKGDKKLYSTSTHSGIASDGEPINVVSMTGDPHSIIFIKGNVFVEIMLTEHGCNVLVSDMKTNENFSLKDGKTELVSSAVM